MNTLRTEITKCMSGLAGNAKGAVTARFVFPSHFTGFKGHFPDSPIVPGVCKIQALLVMVETFYGRGFRLQEIVQAKFFLPVSCDEEMVFCFSKGTPNENTTTIKATVSSNDKKVAKLEVKGVFESIKKNRSYDKKAREKGLF